MTFIEWIRYGIENNYCGAPVCITHDGEPTTEIEDNEIDLNGSDAVCIMMSRVYDGDIELKRDVEANHAPSVWRGL
jgi:hypothetical protein